MGRKGGGYEYEKSRLYGMDTGTDHSASQESAPDEAAADQFSCTACNYLPFYHFAPEHYRVFDDYKE